MSMFSDHYDCRDCKGTGKIITYWKLQGEAVEPCPKCDGTGNGRVDGEKERYKRRVAEIERRLTSQEK